MSSPTLSRLFSTPQSLIQHQVPRLAIQIEALDKCGKTHWALTTAPGPICVVTNDPGTLTIVKKAISAPYNKTIPYVMELAYPDPDPSVTRASDVNKSDQAIWQREWSRYKSGITAVINDKSIRTLITDTEDGLWQLCMLSHFGKTQKIPQHLRTECNADYTALFWSLYKSRPDLNLVRIQKLKKEYKPNSKGEQDWTGNYESTGFNQSGFLVDMVIRVGWDKNYRQFYSECDRVTRFGAHLVGQRWYDSGGQNGFGWLGLTVFPETALTPAWWGF